MFAINSMYLARRASRRNHMHPTRSQPMRNGKFMLPLAEYRELEFRYIPLPRPLFPLYFLRLDFLFLFYSLLFERVRLREIHQPV